MKGGDTSRILRHEKYIPEYGEEMKGQLRTYSLVHGSGWIYPGRNIEQQIPLWVLRKNLWVLLVVGEAWK